MWSSSSASVIGRSLARYWLAPARFQPPSFKPDVRFFRTRLNDDLRDVACMMPDPVRAAAFHRVVMPVVTAFADSRSRRTHLAHAIAGLQSCRACTKGLLAIAGMPSRSPLRRRDQSKVPSLQRVVLHAFTTVGSEVARLRASHRSATA